MSYFPFFIELDGRTCLIVGGGDVAFRKIREQMMKSAMRKYRRYAGSTKYWSMSWMIRKNAAFIFRLL